MEKTEGPGSEDAIMQQYPSPNADGQDSYYANQQRDQQGEQPSDQQATPQQLGRRASISAEELQLAAQLTQGLAPMMAAADNPPAPDASNIQHQDPGLENHDPALHNQDPSLHQQEANGEPQGPRQGPELQQPQAPSFQGQDQTGLHNQDANSYQHLMPHPNMPPQDGHPPQHPYGDHTPNQQHLAPHTLPPNTLPPNMQLAQLAQQQYAAASVDSIPPRKRSKVSRACDECRRKKVKCDAPSEIGEEPCTNCRKSNISCLFSRIPQKRGPSKGYIKELADRIHHIEGKLGGQGSLEGLDLSALRRESAEAFSSPLPLDESRKRPYSSISGDNFSTPLQNKHAGWGSEPRVQQTFPTPSDRNRSPYSVNGLAPQPAKGEPSAAPQPAASMDVLSMDLQFDHVRDIEEPLFNDYLSIIHPVFPLLASSRARVQADLAHCPFLLREAFLEALYSLMVLMQTSLPRGDSRQAHNLLLNWRTAATERSAVVDRVYLQTLLLMIIEIDNAGSAGVKGQLEGPSKPELLGWAVGQAYQMKLHQSRVNPDPESEIDPDTDEKVVLRAWWSLIQLDRWNAVGSGNPLMIHNDMVVVLPGLKSLVGEAGYEMIRLARILGYLTPAALVGAGADGSFSDGLPPSGPNGAYFNLAVEMFRETFPSNITPTVSPILHLSYWHLRLLSYLMQPSALSSDIMWAAKKSVELLTEVPQLRCPLNHQFTWLTSISLLELSKVEKTRLEATRLLREILDLPIPPSAWNSAIRDKIAGQIRPSTSSGAEAAANQSLQHLADLAAATGLAEAEGAGADGDGAGAGTSAAEAEFKTEEPPAFRISDNYEAVGFNPRPTLRDGYMNAVVSAA